jgi:hypothetical protein
MSLKTRYAEVHKLKMWIHKPNTAGAEIGFKLKSCGLQEFAELLLISMDQVGLSDIPAMC